MSKRTVVAAISVLTGALCGLLPMAPLANAAQAPVLSIGGPSGSLKAGQPESFGCTTPGTFAKGTSVTFNVIGLGGGATSESGSVSVSGSSVSSVQYAFGSLTAGSYEADCSVGSGVSAFVRFTITH